MAEAPEEVVDSHAGPKSRARNLRVALTAERLRELLHYAPYTAKPLPEPRKRLAVEAAAWPAQLAQMMQPPAPDPVPEPEPVPEPPETQD